jgi:hypothetical protein
MISKLYYKLANIAKDKLLHYFISYIIVDFCLSISYCIGLTNWLSLLIAVSVASLCIFGKETLDQIKYKGWDWKDILAGYLGVITKLILFLPMIL